MCQGDEDKVFWKKKNDSDLASSGETKERQKTGHHEIQMDDKNSEKNQRGGREVGAGHGRAGVSS